tara:strand:- start:208 stop:924 length:717 start_codon:yes stop_codon:yes gene_type:complete
MFNCVSFWDREDFQGDASETIFVGSLPPDDATDAHPLSEQTLEQASATGKTAYDTEKAYKRVTLHACPAVLLAVIHNLVQKMPDQKGQRKSEAAVFRLLTKLGACKLITLPEGHLLGKQVWVTAELASDGETVIENQYEMGMYPESPPYILDQVQLKTVGRKWNASMFGWVQEILYILADILEMPLDVIAVIAIIAAISCSEEYVPQPIVAVCKNELKRFQLHIRATFWAETDLGSSH